MEIATLVCNNGLNYDITFQTYSMYEYLKKQGNQVQIVDYNFLNKDDRKTEETERRRRRPSDRSRRRRHDIPPPGSGPPAGQVRPGGGGRPPPGGVHQQLCPGVGGAV